jgi:hypothetical protein
MGVRWSTLGFAALVATTCAYTASAQPEPDPTDAAEPATPEKSPAQALFDQGLDDMLAGKFETGCAALSESYRLDPLPGALFTLAECQMGWGHLATAQTRYREYLERVSRMAAESKQAHAERADVAEAKLGELEGRVPILTIRLSDTAPSSARVTRNGELVAPALFGKPLPIDPGEQRLVVESEDGTRSERVLMLIEGEREDVTLEVGEADAGGGGGGAGGEGGGGAEGGASMHPLMVGALVAGSIGAVGLIGGTIAGAVAISKKGVIDDECVDNRCTGKGLSAVDSGQTAGTASTILFVLGGLGVGAAVTLFVLAPDTSEADDGGVSSLSFNAGVALGGGSVGLDWRF